MEDALLNLLFGSGILSGAFVLFHSIEKRLTKYAIWSGACLAAGVVGFSVLLDYNGPIWLSFPLVVFSLCANVLLIKLWWSGAFTPAPEEIEPDVVMIEPEPEPEPIPVFESLEEAHRTEHGMVVAGTGHGKTMLFKSLILDDLEKDATIIVIDSQGQLIDNLLHVVPVDRLVHITPTDKKYPLSLNLFDKDQDSSLYEYIFSAMDAEMTSKQASLYRYASRLVSVIPGGNIDTLRKLLRKDGIVPYREHISKLSPLAQDFFNHEFDGKDYISTKEEILRRLYAVLENETFAEIFCAKENRVNLAKEMNDKKVILIDTAKRTLTGDTFKIFGRFFIAQMARAIFTRTYPYGHRVYIYIDEAADYFNGEDLLIELFTQSRKQNVALMISFQYLAQLPEKVNRAVMANTSIKLAGGNSAGDRLTLAKEMGLVREVLHSWPKGVFTLWYKQRPNRTETLTVVLGRLETLGRRSQDELDTIRHKMRQLYSKREDTPQNKPTTDDPFADFEERS